MVKDHAGVPTGLSLFALQRIGQRVLIGRLGHADTLHADAKPGVVHHGEHRSHALVLFPNQPAGRAIVFHDRGRRPMQAQLVFKADNAQRVALTGFAIFIRQELRDDKQADPLCPRRTIRQAGQHKVTDVLGKIVVAPGDKNLLARDRIGAIVIPLRFGRQRAHVRARSGLGQVHGSAPFTRDQLGQIDRFDLFAGVVLHRFDLAKSHQGVQGERQAGPAHHVVHCGGDGCGKAHTTVFRIGRDTQPTAFCDLGEGLGETGRGAYNTVLQICGVQITIALQGGHHLVGHLARFGEDR